MPRDVELILLKQLSSCLAIPMFVADADGQLVFFNESAEPLVGRRFEEMGELSLSDWGDLLQATDEMGRPFDDDERPLVAALRQQEPVHRHFFIRDIEGERREVKGTAFPLVREDGKLLGALGMFWRPGEGKPARVTPPAAGRPRRQYEVEAILMRRLASYLATPIYLVGNTGQLLYFNAAAERILGGSFDQMTEASRDEVYESFSPRNLDGSPIERGTHPLTFAREQREPAHRRFWIRGIDSISRLIEGTAFPLIGQSGRDLGAVGVFWEIENS